MPHHGSSTTSNTGASRTEQDSMGSVQVPLDALWGAQTERARQNFQLSGQRFPVLFIDSLALW